MKTAAVLATALTMAVGAEASEWNFYGSARVETFYTDVDKGATGTSAKNFNQDLQSNSRIGAKVRVNDEIKARFEYGTDDGNANIRQLWGEWNFGPGTLLIGQTYTPIYTVYSNSVYDSGDALQGYGAISVSRKPMVRLSFGGFQIAAVSPKTNALTGTATEVTLPKIEAAYSGGFNNVSYKISGAYQTYEIDNTYDVDTYLIGFGGKLTFGKGFLAGTVYTGQNLGPYGFKDGNVDMDPNISGGVLLDNEAIGYTLVAGYKVNDMLALEAGYGYQEGEDDNATVEEDASQYYLQAKITMAPGVYVVPEIGVRDDENATADKKETTYFGAKWQINF